MKVRRVNIEWRFRIFPPRASCPRILGFWPSYSLHVNAHFFLLTRLRKFLFRFLAFLSPVEQDDLQVSEPFIPQRLPSFLDSHLRLFLFVFSSSSSATSTSYRFFPLSRCFRSRFSFSSARRHSITGVSTSVSPFISSAYRLLFS